MGKWIQASGRVVAMATLVMAMFVVGCSSTPKVEVDPAAERDRQFRESLANSTGSLNTEDLPAAKKFLADATRLATDYDQKLKVRSVELLISGTEAYMGGNVEKAVADWSQIPDPILAREVRAKAKAELGIDVPAR